MQFLAGNVVEVTTQYEMRSLVRRSLKLDIKARESKTGQIFNVEVQRADKGASRKRARYHSVAIDVDTLEADHDFSELPETYVIFITENDVLGGNKLLYHVDRRIAELDNALFEDESHILYVNSKIQNETALGQLMHDFYCTKAKDMKNKVLADRVRYFKETKGGQDAMCKAMEDRIEEESAIKVESALLQTLKNLMKNTKVNAEEALKAMGIPQEEHQKYIDAVFA